ncbi:hypothetical protein ERO13_D10G066500v2 [Gossypium hirsutum]|uniref:Uncharacterized protein n=1 Tax=Gossypium hirsutum TaxID=3635 RepID=A0A1U8KBL2_GOSHI|nr:uncharacterized protein LOC107913885 [Gossypium hirsutum]KAG4124910.1 hypothetical protein ERO13_D10G066500v2 [Gossypium hirsutum]
MEGSERKVSFSSPPIKSYASPNGSDENDRSNQQMGLNLQTQKKQAGKTFMSPTICAASKVSFPRKKVLAERNESLGSNSSNTHFSKSPCLDSKPSPKIISKACQKNSPNLDHKVASKDPSSHNTPLSYNSSDGTPSPGPYDPLNNYLSQRPQFLRYNPSRRKEIFLRLEMEGKEGDGGADTVSSDNSSLASSPSQEDEEIGDEYDSLLEQEDEESDTECEEEAEEEVAWSLRGVLKYFLLSVVLLLSTSYISSTNSPVSAPAFESPILGFHNLSFGIGEGFEVGYKFLDGKQEHLGLLSFTQAIADEVIEEEMTENASMGHIVNISLELEDRIVEAEEMVEEENKKACEEELIMMEEASEELAENIELQEIEETGEQIEDVKEDGETHDVIVEELVETGKVFDEMVRDIEQQGQQTAEVVVFLQGDHQASLLSEGTDSSEEIRVVPKETSDMVQSQIMRFRNAVSVLEKWSESLALNLQEVNPLKGLNQRMGTEVFLKVAFGVLTISAIVASFALGSNIRRKGTAASKQSSLVDKQSTQPAVKEKPSLPLPVEREEPKELAIPNTMPLITSAVESGAPSVELLAEFEVGVISRSLKSSAISSRMNDEVSSSHSYSSEKDLGNKDHQQGFSEMSAVNSTSSERSSAKKKHLGKELGSNDSAGAKGEGRNKEVTTPLRRSARIRNRADIVSP